MARAKNLKRRCLKEPIPEIFDAAKLLAKAVEAHFDGSHEEAQALIRKADMPTIAQWTESIWGKSNKQIHGFRILDDSPEFLAACDRPKPRMPRLAQRREILARDGHHCRFCGIPVIAPEVRKKLHFLYPEAARWGRRNADQHAALQCMWLQYDHVLPNQRGGPSDLENVVITCAPCNFGRMEWTCAEGRLIDPRTITPLPSWAGYAGWNGLSALVNVR